MLQFLKTSVFIIAALQLVSAQTCPCVSTTTTCVVPTSTPGRCETIDCFRYVCDATGLETCVVENILEASRHIPDPLARTFQYTDEASRQSSCKPTGRRTCPPTAPPYVPTAPPPYVPTVPPPTLPPAPTTPPVVPPDFACIQVIESALVINPPPSTYSITFNFDVTVTSTVRGLFNDARDKLALIIVGPSRSLPIDVRTPYIDGPGGLLGTAGPTAGINSGAFAYSTAGYVELDSADLDSYYADGRLFNIILHEVLHVVGFGTMWNLGNNAGKVYVDGSGVWLGANANAFNAAAGCGAVAEVELDGGGATANRHWDETKYVTELMTGQVASVGVVSEFSNITAGSLQDIGFNINYFSPALDPYFCARRRTTVRNQESSEGVMIPIRPLFGIDEESNTPIEFDYDHSVWTLTEAGWLVPTQFTTFLYLLNNAPITP